jgi:Zn-dependent protease with chaperone function
MARFRIVLVTLLASGCAGLQTRPPEINRVDAARITTQMQRDAITTHIDRSKALLDLGWPILKANAALCDKKIQRSFGWRLLDAEIAEPFVQGLRAADIRAAGYGDAAAVALVIAGSPADTAGIIPGDRIKSVGDQTIGVAVGVKALGKIIIAEIKKTKSGKPIAFVLAHDGAEDRRVTMVPETICSYPLVLSRSGAVNAVTNGKSLTMYLGLMRAEPDARKIQFVIAHELAHAMLRHPQKSVRNSLVSGGAVLGTFAASLGWVADQSAALVGAKPTVPYQRRGAGLASYPWGKDFEREADYVGLYLLARSGVDVAGVEDLFTTFARESPSGTWLGLTHPESANRKLSAIATLAEIKEKRAAGKPLLPEGWTPNPLKTAEPKHGRADTPSAH